MSRSPSGRDQRARALSATLRSIRNLRGLDMAEMAHRMGLTRRAYERFEAGNGRVDLERILAFAEVTDSDSLAIVTALVLGRPALGVECADNKLHWVYALALERFSRDRGDSIRRFETATLIDAFESAFRELALRQDDRDDQARAWFAKPIEEPPTQD